MLGICLEGSRQSPPILTHLMQELLTLGRTRRQAIFLGPMPIALQPLWLDLAPQPIRRNNGQDIESMAQRFHHTFGSIERSYLCQHMGRVGSLATMRFEPATFFAQRQHCL